MIGKTVAVAVALLVAATYTQFTKGDGAVTFPALGDGEDYCGSPNPTSVRASSKIPQIAFMVVCTAPGRGALGPMVNTLVLAGADSSLRSFPIGGDTNPAMLGYDREDRIYWATTWSDETKADTDELKVFSFSERDGAVRIVETLKLPFRASVGGAEQSDDGWLLNAVTTEKGQNRSVYISFKHGRLVQQPDATAARILFWSFPAKAFIAATMDDDLKINDVYAARLDGQVTFEKLTANSLRGEEFSTKYASAPASPVALRVRKLGVDDMQADLLADPSGDVSRSWRWPDHIYTSAMADDGKHFAVVFDDRIDVYRTDGTKGPVGSMASSDAHDALPIFSAPAGGLFVVEQTGVTMIKVED